MISQVEPYSSAIRTCTLGLDGACGSPTTLASVDDLVPALALNSTQVIWAQASTRELVARLK